MNRLDLELEILKILRLKGELRPFQLKKELYPRFNAEQKFNLDEASFRTKLNRALKRLAKIGEVRRTPREHQNVTYSILIDGKRRVMAFDMASLIMADKDKETLAVLGNMMKRMRVKNYNPTSYCFAFIGDAPIAFSKTEDSFKRHLEEEKYFLARHGREINRIRKEVEASHPNLSDAARAKITNERIRNEIGLSVGAYFRGLVKRAEGRSFEERMKIFFEWEEI